MTRSEANAWTSVLPKAPGVYILFDGDKVIYVGSTIRLRTRLRDHKHAGKFDSMRWISVHPADLEERESELVDLLEPSLNRNRVRRPEYGYHANSANKFFHFADIPYTAPAVLTALVVLPARAA